MGKDYRAAILLVDKHRDFFTRYRKDLENLGYEIVLAETHERSVSIVRSGAEVDLVLIDIHPWDSMSGVRTAELILEKKKLPLIFILENPDPETLELVDRVGSYGFVTRKSSVAEVHSYLKMALRLYQADENARKVLTEHRQIEEALRESEEFLSRSQEVAHVGSWKLDLTGNVLKWSDEVYHIFGFEPQEFEAIYTAFLEFVHPDDRMAVDEAYSRSLREGTDSYEIQHRIVRQSTGEVRHVHERCVHVRDSMGNVIESIGMIQDITEHRRAEERLKENNKRLESLLDITQALNTSLDLDFLMQAIVDGAVRVMNLDSGAIYLLDQGKLCLNATIPALPENFPDQFRYASLADHLHIKEAIDKKRPVIMHDAHSASLTPAEREVIKARNLRSNLFLPIRLRNQVLGVLIISSNKEPYTFQDGDISLLQGFAEKAAQAIENALLFEKNRKHTEKLEQLIEKRKLAEQALEKSLKEKDVLLSEIHHRVKNNMAIISSMISLQSQDFKKNASDQMLQDITVRIKSMAMVHEMVYEHQNFTEINAGKLLKRLVGYLEKIYLSHARNISFEIRTGDIMLDMNKSVPFTLLVSEVVTNAFKHAYTDRRNGRILILLEKHKERQGKFLRLAVEDDGVGLENLEKLNKPVSFGYTIIHGLAGQLGGELAFSTPPQGGLRVEVRFPERRRPAQV
ncbi:histidine kinase dimerization/phosphoacceptor domain -containing protein [Balneolales bacterium ANBcel1]|nr:histidine kinase dimerization/phosphoacceptor domain -containing protein [Balneolales bacterium ANBcel1]